MEFRYLFGSEAEQETQDGISREQIVCDISGPAALDFPAARCLAQRPSSYLLPQVKVTTDGEEGLHFYYDITDTMNLKAYLAEATTEECRMVLRDLPDAVDEISRAGIDSRFLLLSEQYLYVDLKSEKILILCLPVLGEAILGALAVMAQEFLSRYITEEGPQLIRKKTEEVFPILADRTVVGKKRSTTQLRIKGNPAISREHCVITKEDGRYYLEDLNSTNHTWIEKEFLPPMTKAELLDGYVIWLADEEFYFRMKEG